MGKSNAAGEILLMGNGYSERLWRSRLDTAGVHAYAIGVGVEAPVLPEQADIMIETEDSQYYQAMQEAHSHAHEHEHEHEHDEELEAAEEGIGDIGEFGEPERHGNGHGEATGPMVSWASEIALAEGGVILVPCYSISPTHLAHAYGQWAESAVGYTLFPSPGEPPRATPVIELARALQTSEAAWQRALEFTRGIGFRPEAAGDAPGLVFGRTVACLINEAAIAYSEGIASADDMDAAMKLGVNYPKGLLAWADELGLEVVVDILEGLYDYYQEDRYRPSPLLRKMLLAGKQFHPPA